MGIVDCDLPEQWAALRAAPTTRTRERWTGFEPATFSLARRHSTAELPPQDISSILHLKGGF